MLRTGFEPDHDPLEKLKHIIGAGAIASTVPRGKFTTELPKLRRPLTVDAAIHFATDPSISAIALYPIEIQLEGRHKPHVPEFGLKMAGGTLCYIDVIPLPIQEELPWIARRTSELKATIFDRYSASYSVLDERDLWIEPRMSNLRIMYSHLNSDDKRAVWAVRDAIHRIPMPASIADVRAASDLEPFDFVYRDDDGREVSRERMDYVDRTFTAVMQLAADGEIDIDLSRKFSDRTTVWPSMRTRT